MFWKDGLFFTVSALYVSSFRDDIRVFLRLVVLWFVRSLVRLVLNVVVEVVAMSNDGNSDKLVQFFEETKNKLKKPSVKKNG